jgi:hypothetical protein
LPKIKEGGSLGIPQELPEAEVQLGLTARTVRGRSACLALASDSRGSFGLPQELPEAEVQELQGRSGSLALASDSRGTDRMQHVSK